MLQVVLVRYNIGEEQHGDFILKLFPSLCNSDFNIVFGDVNLEFNLCLL